MASDTPLAKAPLAAALREATLTLQAKLDSSTVNRHGGLKGRLREQALMAALRPFVATRFELSGPSLITSAHADHWREQDVVVTDATRGSPHMFGNRIHPIEVVTGVIEVKTEGTKDEILDAVDKLASVLALQSSDTVMTSAERDLRDEGVPPTFPFTGIFCYDAPYSDDSIIENFRASCKSLPPWQWPHSLCVLGRFSTQWVKADEMVVPSPGVAATEYGELLVYRDRLDAKTAKRISKDADDEPSEDFDGLALYLFHLVMSETMQQYRPPALVLERYFEAGLFHVERYPLP